LFDILEQVRMAQNGDKNRLVELISMKKEQLYRIAYSYLKDNQKVMDVMQDGIVWAFHEINNLREGRYFYTWYIKILTNICKEYLRRDRKVLFVNELRTKKDDSSLWNEDWLDVKTEIQRLKEEFREVIILRYLADMTVKEISDVLNCPEGTIKSRLFYALKKLKKMVESKEGKANEM